MTTTASETRGGRLPVITAITGTIAIAAGAFWLSFIALTNLAQRSGYAAEQAWVWPLIVDGIIVVATVATVAIAGQRSAWYPWFLLMCGAGISVTANFIHAILTADPEVPWILAGSVASVPSLVLLAITHLTIVLNRHRKSLLTAHALPTAEVMVPPVPALRIPALSAPPGSESGDLPTDVPNEVSGRDEWSGREVAEALRAGGWSNKKIARYLDVHPSTVGRWLPQPATIPTNSAEPVADTGLDFDAAPEMPAAEKHESKEEPS